MLGNVDKRPAVFLFRRGVHNNEWRVIAVDIRFANPEVAPETGVAGNGPGIGIFEAGKLSDPSGQHLQAVVHDSGGYPDKSK